MPFEKQLLRWLNPLLLGGLLLLGLDAHAQVTPAESNRLLERYRVEVDTTLAHPFRYTPEGREDVVDGVFRAIYAPVRLQAPPRKPEEAAARVLEQEKHRLGLQAPDREVRLLRMRRTPGGYHLTYQQMLDGIPVYARTLTVSLDRERQPTFVTSAYRPLKAPERAPTWLPAIEARKHLEALFPGRKRVSEPERFFYPTRRPIPVWRWLVWPESPRGEWEVLIRADTGEPLQVRNLALSLKPYDDGQGMVFDPDPLTTSGHDYSPPYVDNNDADVPELNAQRRAVTLRDLDQDAQGRYVLSGPYVTIIGETASGSTVYTPPAETDPNAFTYTRANDHFEAVNAYYHIDTSQRYVQSLGFTDIHASPLKVNPHGEGAADNSQYYPSLDLLSLGDGGIDDGEDAAVILHEYGHALLSASTPGLLNTYQGRAFHEGWSDYWIASYLRALAESGQLPPFDWRELFRWDGNNGSWQGRYLQHNGHYPEDLSYTDKYTDGLLWAATLMEIYDEVGRTVCDRLNLQSHAYLSGSSFTFVDAAEALIQADRDLYDGAHLNTLLRVLGNRGFINPSAYGPAILHHPLSDTEDLASTRPVDAQVESVAAAIDSVWLHFRWGAGPWQQTALQPDTGTVYRGALPLPPQPDSVFYYLRARDTQGQVSVLPPDAPTQTYRFYAGPDTRPPEINHSPITSAVLSQWPAIVYADVQDNLGVDTVRVHYEWLREGHTRQTGVFGLIPDEKTSFYSGPFPVPADSLQAGDVFRYRIEARDRARIPNTTWFPALSDPPFSFTITVGGLLALYTFEVPVPDLQTTGVWEQGTPAYGTYVTHSPTQAWGTNLQGPYPETASLSSLTLPPLNLQGVTTAYLIFWHWYDTEHAGDAHPDNPNPNTLLWDGGNIKVSTDGGTTWSVITPMEGYSGKIGTDFGNPLAGEPAFGGFSYGWRRSIVPLPTGSTVQIRFDFGTDESNQDRAEFFAGWYLDDVQITTDLPVDRVPPAVLELPPTERKLPARKLFARIPLALSVTDDTGVESVHVAYTLTGESHTYEGTYRLPMSPHTLNRFEGALPLPSTAPGDVLTYTFRVRDVAGNERSVQTPEGTPFHIRFLLTEVRSLLATVQATGAWEPRPEGGWHLEASSGTPFSALLLPPLDLPANAEDVFIRLQHRGALQDGSGGTIMYSLNDGASWAPLPPLQGYPDTLASGLPAFTGIWDTTETVVDLSPFAGQQVRLRVDYLPGGSGYWEIYRMEYLRATEAPAFEVPLTLRLHTSYPNPFHHTTTLGFTIPAATHVRLELFDILGRRVRLLLDDMREPGTYHLMLDGSDLADGTYILRLTAMGQQRIQKLIIVH